jgi:23S rRNA (cytosine1962-C5)-methyltransferase
VPIVRITRKGARRLRTGHPWIYRGDVEAPPAEVRPGDLVEVAGPDGMVVAVAAWSDRSQIALRVTPLTPGMDPEAGWQRAVESAVARRAGRPPVARLVNGDADGLPGLVVDRYGDALGLQTLTQAAARRQAETVDTLVRLTGARLVVARNEPRVREYEGLPRDKAVVHGEGPTEVEVPLRGLRWTVDLWEGQKTGTFLDQADNQAVAGSLARGEALDCFSYDGGFALALAQAGCLVTAVDSSEPALARLRRHAERNGLEVETQADNVFEALRAFEREGRQFDTIVLDPPAFVKSRSALEAGRRAYKEINLRAFKLLRPGGLLVTCSCSANMDRPTFEATVADAAGDARRWARVIERRGPAADHPSLLTAPETDYLKCLLIEVQ